MLKGVFIFVLCVCVFSHCGKTVHVAGEIRGGVGTRFYFFLNTQTCGVCCGGDSGTLKRC